MLYRGVFVWQVKILRVNRIMSAGKDFLLFLFSESFYKRGMGDKTDLVMIVKTMPMILFGDGAY